LPRKRLLAGWKIFHKNMQTKLIEFKNQNGEILRGIFAVPKNVSGEAVFLQGFERNATAEKKFKTFANTLAGYGVASLRYDASGCGLSDGDFAKTTLAKRSGELLKALEVMQKEFGRAPINFIAHSVGMCPLAMVFDEIKPIVGKMVFIAPALNQKDLMRYYFVCDTMKKKNPGIEINWSNYKQYFDEALFLEDCQRPGRMARENYINAEYFLETKDFDFTHSFDAVKDRILHVHGECDRSVPLESLGVEFPNRIIVPGGDHDLERPDFWEQWFPRAVDFLTKNL
jgi:pimeloyl-ACP methyl ester carboxylesterase